MEIWLLIFGLAIGAVLFIGGKLRENKESFVPTLAPVTDEEENKHDITAPNEQDWWNGLPLSETQQLALALAKKTMPIWQSYTQETIISYKDSTNGAHKNIDPRFLQSSLAILTVHASDVSTLDVDPEIRNCYNEFVEPIVALQDGLWTPPFPVKKIFFSMYYILKSMVERTDEASQREYLSISIAHAFDSLDMTRLYNSKEINAFIDSYKVLGK